MMCQFLATSVFLASKESDCSELICTESSSIHFSQNQQRNRAITLSYGEQVHKNLCEVIDIFYLLINATMFFNLIKAHM